MNIETGFITELLLSEDITTVVDAEISARFLSGRNRQALKFIFEHHTKYGKIPSTDSFQKRFPTFELGTKEGEINTGERLSYWCDELRVKNKHNTIADGVEEALASINEYDTDTAYDILKKVVLTVENEIVLADKKMLTKNTKKRKEDYLKRQKSGGMTGIPSFIDGWDKLTGGMNKSELSGCMGFTGLGKSWLICIKAVLQAKAGYKVFVGSTEMSTDMIIRRIDAIWCLLNYSDFVKGQLKPDQQKRYFKFLEEMEGNEKVNLVVEHVDDVTQFSAKISQYDPDVAYIDGAYIMQDTDEDSDWIGVRNVIRTLHKICLSKKIPIEFTTQAKEEFGNSLKTINFSKAIAQEVDVFYAIEQDEQMRNDKEVRLNPLKLREGKLTSKVYLNWDFDLMNFSTLFEERISESSDKSKAKGVITID